MFYNYKNIILGYYSKNMRFVADVLHLPDNPQTALDRKDQNLFFDCKTICDFHRIACLLLESDRQGSSVLLFYQHRCLETK